MRGFLLKIAAFAMVLFLVDKVFYIFLVVAPGLQYDDRLERVVNGKMDKDLIILGSSRGARNIIASQIQDSLGISAFNLSYPGSDIEFHEFLLRSLLKFNKAPQVVVLAVDDRAELLQDPSIVFRLDRLYPLMKYAHITEEMIQRGEKNALSRFLVLARINRSNFDVRRTSVTEVDTIMACGSMPISFQREGRTFRHDRPDVTYPVADELPHKVKALHDLQEACASRNIELIVVISPNFHAHDRAFQQRMEQLLHADAVLHVYDTSNTIYSDRRYYYDESHLQKKGAEVFTNELITTLRASRNALGPTGATPSAP